MSTDREPVHPGLAAWVNRVGWAFVVLGLLSASLTLITVWSAVMRGPDGLDVAGSDPSTDVMTYDIDRNDKTDFVQIDDTVLAVPPRPGGTDVVGIVFTRVFAIVCAVITGCCSVFVSRNAVKDAGLRVDQLERQLAEVAPSSSTRRPRGTAARGRRTDEMWGWWASSL